MKQKLVPDTNLAYILFTSGGTGKPKGVQITRGNHAEFIDSMDNIGLDITEKDRCLQPFDLTFDFSVSSYVIPLVKENGLEGFYFLGYTLFVDDEYSKLKELGFDAIVSCRLDRNVKHDFGWAIRKIISVIFQTPRRTNYKKLISTWSKEFDKTEDVFPTMIPNWDHTPRSGVNGDLFTNSTPYFFQIHASQVLSTIVA